MSTWMVSRDKDPIERKVSEPIHVTVAGNELEGEKGQTIAGVMMANGILSWRTSTVNSRPRGLFCGIGVCFDCVVTVNGQRDIRACQRRCTDGDVITYQHDELPEVKE